MKWFTRKPKLEFSEIELSEGAELFIRSTPEHFRLGSFTTFQRGVRLESYPKLDARGIAAAMDSILVSQGAVSGRKIFQTVGHDALLTELLVNRLCELLNSFYLEILNGLNSERALSRRSLELFKDLENKSTKLCKEFIEELNAPSNTPSGAPHARELASLMKLLALSIEVGKQLMVQMGRTADYIDEHLDKHS